MAEGNGRVGDVLVAGACWTGGEVDKEAGIGVAIKDVLGGLLLGWLPLRELSFQPHHRPM